TVNLASILASFRAFRSSLIEDRLWCVNVCKCEGRHPGKEPHKAVGAGLQPTVSYGRLRRARLCCRARAWRQRYREPGRVRFGRLPARPQGWIVHGRRAETISAQREAVPRKRPAAWLRRFED